MRHRSLKDLESSPSDWEGIDGSLERGPDVVKDTLKVGSAASISEEALTDGRVPEAGGVASHSSECSEQVVVGSSDLVSDDVSSTVSESSLKLVSQRVEVRDEAVKKGLVSVL